MRRSDPALADLLFEEPYLFDFFQAVRLLDKIGGGRGPVGHVVAPSREAVRFVGHLGLNFPPSPIFELKPGERFALVLMSSVNDVGDVQRDGKDLVLVATVGQVLHFRIFDHDGKMVVDTDARKLTAKAKQIEDLKARLIHLWPPHGLSKSEKDQILDYVTSIVGHITAAPPRMSTPFMGLIGASGALPTVYTESLIALRSRQRNAAALDFLDLFHHRLVSLYYRAWEKYNVPSLWERGGQENRDHPGSDAFSSHLFDLIGLGSPPLRNCQAVPDPALIFYAGFLAQQHRPAVSLELLLRDHFGQPAEVISFFGRWLRLEEEQQSRMGRNIGTFNSLGIDTVAGQRVWDDQCKFRVRLGPLGFEEFRNFLPGGRLADELMDLIRFFVRGELDFDVQLVLKAEEVPNCLLSRDSRGAAQLGRTSWLRTREFIRDADDSVARPSATGPSRSGSTRC